jgi:ADP-ribose pyrophosphatase YjhB (NUDIX family)
MVELGERMEDALVREVQEETAWCVRVEKQLALFDYIERDEADRVRYHYVLADFLCHYVAGELQAGSDVLDARLVPLAELSQYDLTSKALEVIQSGWHCSNGPDYKL